MDRSARPGSGLSLDRIVRTAITIADEQGLASLSMRRVASALDVGAMSLYRHVPDKGELVDLMVDAAYGEIRYPVPGPDGWRARLELAARQEWAMYRRHLWVLTIVAGTHRPPLGPNVLANIEWVLAAVEGYGLDPDSTMQVYLTVSDYVQGAALYLRTEAEDERRTGVTSRQWWESKGPALARLLDSGRFPELSRFVQASAETGSAAGKNFEFGLQRVLDGLAVFLDGPEAAIGLSKVTKPGPAGMADGEAAVRPASSAAVRTGGETPLTESTAAVLELLGRRWTLELLYLLCQGDARFSDLAGAVPGISRRLLTERLRQLTDAGLLRQQVTAGPPARTTYGLTGRGAGLRGALEQIHAWADTPPGPDDQR
ncbi:hypothetical protein GCM10027290_26090 [Micromonospora sonneratiae]|uniref:TetR/AcrR family transcriptional regulator C-terminal domain-containing protein n=1 Tax=Micromonospora sonneratiae TaxID=1184706 RepID=A0ABW3YPN6_9ACTN